MKKGIFVILFSVVGVFFIIHATLAVSLNAIKTKSFGGRIINNKALKIAVLEATNFICVVPGSTITIKPNNSSYPTNYFIPIGVKMPKTPIRAGQGILGKYSSTKTPITCTQKSVVPVTKTVNLDTITLFNTSTK